MVEHSPKILEREEEATASTRVVTLAVLCALCTALQCTASLIVSRAVTTGSPSRGGDVAVEVFDINQPRLPTPFYPVLVTVSVFMALSTVFHSINSSDNSPLSHSFNCISFHKFSRLSLCSSGLISA